MSNMPVVLGVTPGLLPIGTRFVHRYSEGWGSDEPGAVLPRNRWRVEVEIRGYNGVCGYWITEFWKWDRSGEIHHEQPRSLSYVESRELEKAYAERMAGGVLEPASCYLCHVTTESDPDVTLRNAGLPQSDLYVCSRCDGSWQHQTDKREAWSAEESEV